MRIFMRDLKQGKHNLTHPFSVLTPTNISSNYSLSVSMKFDEFWCITLFLKWRTLFILMENKKRERTFPDKKLWVQISTVRYSTVRLCQNMIVFKSAWPYDKTIFLTNVHRSSETSLKLILLCCWQGKTLCFQSFCY